MDLILDGVALIKAPQILSKRQKHAAQAIKAMWMKKGEAMDPDVHTFNRYLWLHHERELQREEHMAEPCGSARLVQPCVPTVAIHFHLGCQSMGCSWVSKFLCGVASVSMVGSH